MLAVEVDTHLAINRKRAYVKEDLKISSLEIIGSSA